MPNRYGTYDSRQQDMDTGGSFGGGGGNWWAANDPQIVAAPGSPAAEAGGIAGTNTTIGGTSLPYQAPGSTWAGNQPGATTWQAPGGGMETSAVGGPEQFGGSYEQWFRALVGNRPWNQNTLNALMPVLSHYGIKLTPPNASGDQTKIQLPTGEWVRVGFGEGKPVWIPQTNAQGQSLFSGGAGAGSYSGPGAIPPPFQAPSFADLQQEPGYQARMQMGMDALQHSAAAQGSLLSGGFQKSLNRYAQDYASNEYGNAYDRAMRKYQENYLTQSADPWSRYRDLYQGGLQATLGSKTTPPLNG